MSETQILISPNIAELEESLGLFEARSGLQLHFIVREELRQSRRTGVCVPSVADHGGYLFSRLYVPTSATDGRPEFTEIACLTSLNSHLTVVYGDARSSEIARVLHEAIMDDKVRALGSGAALLATMAEVVGMLAGHLAELEVEAMRISTLVTEAGALGSVKAIDLLAQCHKELRHVITEFVSVSPVVQGIAQIGLEISGDRLDLRSDSGAELFTRDLEVRALHLGESANRLAIATRNLDRSTEALTSDLEAQSSDARLRANQLVAALVVIFLSPVLLLNLYSQFFAEGAIWSNAFTSRYFWVFIVAVSLVEVGFFRAKKWLR